MRETMTVKSIIGVLIIVIIALSLLPAIVTIVNEQAATLTGASKTLVELIPLFYVIGILMFVTGWATGKI